MFPRAALVAATLTTGLSAGLFAAFAFAVMPGLARSDDRTFVTAMQRINVAILNPWFGLVFGGALVLTIVAVVANLGVDDRAVLWWTVAGLVLYVVMLAITVRVNVPLNNALEAAGDVGDGDRLASVRESFESTWVRWNVARAVVSTAAFGCLIWATAIAS